MSRIRASGSVKRSRRTRPFVKVDWLALCTLTRPSKAVDRLDAAARLGQPGIGAEQHDPQHEGERADAPAAPSRRGDPGASGSPASGAGKPARWHDRRAGSRGG